MKKTLMIILSERLSSIISKGEVTDRYYNPNNIFDEVHLILLNKDNPDLDYVQKMVGNATVFIYNIPVISPFVSCGYNNIFFKRWIYKFYPLIKTIKPDIIRSYGNFINSIVGYNISKKFNIPHLISIHVDEYAPVILKNRTLKQRFLKILLNKKLKISLKNANILLPVYSPIKNSLKSIQNLESTIIYNTVNPSNLIKKDKYTFKNTFKIISIGRQFYAKDISNIILALKNIPNIHFTIVGDGPLHYTLVEKVKKSNVIEKVTFIKSLSNDEITKSLHTFDAFVTHSDFYEVSKCFIECFNVGLPVITNKHQNFTIDEMLQAKCILVNNNPQSYQNAIESLISSQQLREEIGFCHKKFAKEFLSPKLTEDKHSEVYKKFLN